MTTEPAMSVGMSKRSSRGSQMPLTSDARSTLVMKVIDSPSSDRTMPSEMKMASDAATKKRPRRMRCLRARAGETCRSSALSGCDCCAIGSIAPWAQDAGAGGGRRTGPRDAGPVLERPGRGRLEEGHSAAMPEASAHAARVASSSSAGSWHVADLGDLGHALVGEVVVDEGRDGRVRLEAVERRVDEERAAERRRCRQRRSRRLAATQPSPSSTATILTASPAFSA